MDAQMRGDTDGTTCTKHKLCTSCLPMMSVHIHPHVYRGKDGRDICVHLCRAEDKENKVSVNSKCVRLFTTNCIPTSSNAWRLQQILRKEVAFSELCGCVSDHPWNTTFSLFRNVSFNKKWQEKENCTGRWSKRSPKLFQDFQEGFKSLSYATVSHLLYVYQSNMGRQSHITRYLRYGSLRACAVCSAYCWSLYWKREGASSSQVSQFGWR